MDSDTARILLESLLRRTELAHGQPGALVVTEIELKAIAHLLSRLEDTSNASATPSAQEVPHVSKGSQEQSKSAPQSYDGDVALSDHPDAGRIPLDLSITKLPPTPDDTWLCLDFGTAMSKATVVRLVDSAPEEGDTGETIHVLRLGEPGDQLRVHESMLVSSVFIDDEGLVWFGQKAVDASRLEAAAGRRRRLDNIKRRLSEDGLAELLENEENPTDLDATYEQIVLAYLAFYLWTVSSCLKDEGFARNTLRRFALPCLNLEKHRSVAQLLTQLLAEAQVIADSLGASIHQGVPLLDLLRLEEDVRSLQLRVDFIREAITEPLGVAGSLFSWTRLVDGLALIVDIGAGTSDLGLYRLKIVPGGSTTSAFEVKDSSRGLPRAGNYLDNILVEHVLGTAGITRDHPRWLNIRSGLQLDIRERKETLFNESSVVVQLLDGSTVEVGLEEFLELEPVVAFGQQLRDAVRGVLEDVSSTFIDWVLGDPSRRVAIVLTGGGSALPMVRDLKEIQDGMMEVHGRRVPVVLAPTFPMWLQDEYMDLEDDYPRIAVSLGGARQVVLNLSGVLAQTGGDSAPRTLGGFYTKGI